MTFLQNKKIINRFVAEVTFKYGVIDYGVAAKNSFIKPGESYPH